MEIPKINKKQIRKEKMNKEKQVEELEYSWNWFLEHEHLRTNKHNLKIKSIIIEKAKRLKAEIEKGCGMFLEFDKEQNINDVDCGQKCKWCKEVHYCTTCKNLINRLNKIIGENDD